MKNERLSGQSRDEILEMILEETARNPYKSTRKSSTAVSPKSSASPAAANKVKTAPASVNRDTRPQAAPANPDITQIFSASEAEAEALRVEKDIMSEKIEAMRQKKLEGQKYLDRDQSENTGKNIRKEPDEAQTAVRIFPGTPSDNEAANNAAEKIKQLHKEKAAAAKAAIQQKAEIENARRAQQDLENTYTEPSDDEKVNLYIPDDIDEELYEGPRDILTEISRLFQTCVCILFIMFMFFTFIAPIAQVSGESMEPTLSDGDSILTWALGYTPNSGDLVIIDDKTAALLNENGGVTEKAGLDCRIVKRIIATGGDTIDIDFDKGEVKVNDTVLEEEYISEKTTRDSEAFSYPLTIPDGYVFVMGDNRNVSKDSRHPEVGLVPEKEIVGKVVLRLLPFDDAGSVQ